jgi:hypothetical protein
MCLSIPPPSQLSGVREIDERRLVLSRPFYVRELYVLRLAPAVDEERQTGNLFAFQAVGMSVGWNEFVPGLSVRGMDVASKVGDGPVSFYQSGNDERALSLSDWRHSE